MFNHLNFTWLTGSGNGKAWNGNHALSLLVIVNWIIAIYVQITSFNALGSIMFSTLPLEICLFDCNVKYSFLLALLFILEYQKTRGRAHETGTEWNRPFDPKQNASEFAAETCSHEPGGEFMMKESFKHDQISWVIWTIVVLAKIRC